MVYRGCGIYEVVCPGVSAQKGVSAQRDVYPGDYVQADTPIRKRVATFRCWCLSYCECGNYISLLYLTFRGVSLLTLRLIYCYRSKKAYGNVMILVVHFFHIYPYLSVQVC